MNEALFCELHRFVRVGGFVPEKGVTATVVLAGLCSLTALEAALSRQP